METPQGITPLFPKIPRRRGRRSSPLLLTILELGIEAANGDGDEDSRSSFCLNLVSDALTRLRENPNPSFNRQCLPSPINGTHLDFKELCLKRVKSTP